MPDEQDDLDRIIVPLIERAKELACLYTIDELLGMGTSPEDEVLPRVVRTMPSGWQHTGLCRARITLGNSMYETPGFALTPWRLSAEIVPEESPVGRVVVCYDREMPELDEGPFLDEERRLIDAIAKRLGLYLLQRRLRTAHAGMTGALSGRGGETPAWRIVLDFLTHSDHELLQRINRRMVNHLCWTGVPGATRLLASLSIDSAEGRLGENMPLVGGGDAPSVEQISRTFEFAGEHLEDTEILRCIQGWINEEKCLFLVQALENPECGLAETGEALRRFRASGLSDGDLQGAVRTTLRAGLLRRYLLDQPEFLSIAKRHITVDDMQEITERLVYPGHSHGRLGGKGARLFLAHRILAGLGGDGELFANLRAPKSWYVASDGLLAFIHSNRLEEVYNRKYMDLERVRQDYPNIIRVFKSSVFPPEMSKQLAAALDDFGEQPIVVRSSSLLEDRTGASFAGKYKSLFLANQGSKRDRLAALQDAIAEIYASVFGPDPIEYRAERGLLDFNEEMGVLIQAVVGRRVGRWFTPLYSGVAFGSNEFRWSPRIQRDDGLIRMVPGLGTRAVDRMSDDYPVLVAPGQPNLRVNTSPDEIERYAPRKMDVIDLESRRFETIEAETLLRAHGDEIPGARELVSVFTDGMARTPTGLGPDWSGDRFAVTFEGVLTRTPFVRQMHRMLTALREAMGGDVDLEFASDGEHLYLVQCRPQSLSPEFAPATIPRDLAPERVVFSTDREVSNGVVAGVTHAVYIDHDAYDALPELRLKAEVARVVGRLNGILPRRRFVLMGPGRWGSRGDINLGVPVTYSEISNAAMLVEMGRVSGSYVPELSFGTHFFQDMVEAGIRYLPLYPGSPGCAIDESFFLEAQNRLTDLVPAAAGFEGVIRVVDIEAETGGRRLDVLMNADAPAAVGVLTDTEASTNAPLARASHDDSARSRGGPGWLGSMVDRMARELDRERFGVKGVYLVAGGADAEFTPDVGILIHDAGEGERRAQLRLWLDGWARAVETVQSLRVGRSGERVPGVGFVSDAEIESGEGLAPLLDLRGVECLPRA